MMLVKGFGFKLENMNFKDFKAEGVSVNLILGLWKGEATN